MPVFPQPPVTTPIVDEKAKGMTAIWINWFTRFKKYVENFSDQFAPIDGTYIVQTPNTTTTNEQALSSLSTGYMKSTTGTGVVTTTATIPTSDLSGAGASAILNLSGVNTGDQVNITGNAATVTTNANLTGPITSVGNATAVASQTGAGTTFVMNTSPTLVTPTLGVATATSINGLTIPSVSGTAALVRISSATASNSSSITFTGLSSTYSKYIVVLTDILPATDGTALRLRTSSNNGSSYDSAVSDYSTILEYQTTTASATTTTAGATTSTYVLVGAGNADNSLPQSGYVDILSHSSSANYTHLISNVSCHDSTAGAYFFLRTYGIRKTNAVTNAIEFSMASGNITSGTFTLYGVIA